MGDTVETVKVKSSIAGHQGYRVINKADFDSKKDELYTGKGADEAEASLEAGRNTSGTYSEPTPTDIRYPDKDQTEFENNHGAFVGKSAAGLRDELDLPDAPGGLAPDPDFVPGTPEVTEAAKDAEPVAAKAAAKK